MKTLKQIFFSVLFIVLLSNAGWGQISITTITGVAYSQNFDGMGTSGTATLPSGFKIGTDWSTGTTATTQAAGTSGAGILTGTSTGGAYNFANGVTASSTDRSLGFLSSGGYTSPRSIILAFTNNTGTTITFLDVMWDYEKYRSGSRAWAWTFFHGPTATATISKTDGDLSYTADANNTVISNPPLSTQKSFLISDLNIADGSTYYLRWTYTGSGGSTNAQGLGIDNFFIGQGVLPVSLQSFNANVLGNNVKLLWKTVEEINNAGFDVERADVRVQSTGYSKIGFIEGKGTKNSSTEYTYEDNNLQSGKYKYRLKQIDYNGNYEYFELNGEVEVGVPNKYDISQNYPNPFNPVTKISFDLPENGLVNIRLYDMLGREVAVIVNEVRSAGYHTVQFDASKLSSGFYFYKMNSGKFNGIKKMAVLK